MSHIPMRRVCWLAALVVLLSCMTVIVRAGILDDGDAMPYDMSAVEEMERIETMTKQQQQEKAQALIEASQHVATTMQPQLKDPMTAEEQAFFSEKDVDAFLEQRSQARSAAQARAQAEQQAKAEAQARQQAEAEAAAQAAAEAKAHQEQMIRDTQAHAVEAANFAFDHMAHDSHSDAEQAAEFHHGVEQLQEHTLAEGQEQEFDLGLDEGAEVEGESEVDQSADDSADSEADAETEAEGDAESEQDAEGEMSTDDAMELQAVHDAEVPHLDDNGNANVEDMRRARHHFEEIESAGMKTLKRLEFLAKVQQHYGPQKEKIQKAETEKEAKKDRSPHAVFMEARSKSRSSSKASQPWWTSQQGVTSNFHHYQQGVKNALLGNRGAVANAANSYALPLGKPVYASRLNQRKLAAQSSGPVAAYPLIPVQEQGKSLRFNPYSGSDFHPEIPVPAHAPKLPGYMAESQQPFAGAGYYGSGGGQGPHPGSEAFVPLPGVSGKEFGIRAREAWEEHTTKYANDPTAFHDVKNLPEYPYFPSWSRESEIGGRPDLFPRPMFNLPTVNAQAKLAGEAAYRHSQVYYPHLNRPITTPEPLVAAARAQAAVPVAGIRAPRLIRQVIGYPRPEARTSWAGTIPEQFPRPSDSNSFEEAHNYGELNAVPTLAVPYHPLAGRNIMINSGPDKGMHPIYGGFPQYIPVPVAARQEDVVATQ